ncbi:MAG: type II/IV secretion system protein [Planctomycetes bacterium]|nr:type II/IV secretion system protein [Planctomycetota bacterium]
MSSTSPEAGVQTDDARAAAGWLELLQTGDLVSADVLENARRESEGDPDRIGNWLVSHGCLSQRDLALVQAESFGVPFVEPPDYRVDLQNRALIPKELARTHSVFAIFKLERVITLAVARPLDLAVLDQIRLHTGCEVDQCLAARRELYHLIEWAYGDFEEHTAVDDREAPAWDDILKEVENAPAVKLVNVLLDQAAANRASDVHIDGEEQSLRVRYRIDGVLREVPAPPKSLLPAIVSRIKVLAHMDIAETRKPQDGHFKFAADREELDIRVSTLPSTYGEAVVLRLLNTGGRLLSLEELGMDKPTAELFDRLIHLPHGMLLVTGPTGSGKTTTLYSALTRIDRVRQNIITLEDPVEVRLGQIRQTHVNPKAGLTFQTGLRAILRQDPDVVMVGEIRDGETAEIAIQAALTGHLLLSTLHTNSAIAAIARLLDMGVADFLAASALAGVLAQRLCRRLCPHCARPVEKLDNVGGAVPPSVVQMLEGTRLLEAVGCKRCGNTGHQGRVGVFELVDVTDEMRRAILAGERERVLLDMARANGMRALAADGLEKVCRGLIALPELLRVIGRIDEGAVTPDDLTPAAAWQPQATPATRSDDVARSANADFNISTYEQLLGRWLGSKAAAASGGRV